MKSAVLTCLGVLLTATLTVAQPDPADTLSPEQFGLQELTEYLTLKPGDISYRSDYTEPDSFRLKIVADLMAAPLGMIDYATNLKDAYVKGQPEVTARYLYQDLRTEYQIQRSKPYTASIDELQKNYNLFYASASLNQLLTRAAVHLNVVIPRSVDKAMAMITPQQRKFLTDEFKELLVSYEKEEFYSPEQIDSVEKAEEGYADRFVEFGLQIDKDPIIAAGIDCLRDLMPQIKGIQSEINSGAADVARILKGLGALPTGSDIETYLGKQRGWKIGGAGSDYYEGDYWFIFDFGGDDIYNLSYDPAHPHSTIIIDLGGNDSYRAKTDFAIGSGCLSVGLLLDFGGNDHYDAKSFGIGSGFFGFGLVYDAGGDDIYSGDTFVEGTGTFGLGLLIDEGGRDLYNAAMYAQGFGFTEGMGVVYDLEGSDSYYAGGKYKDILRYEDHYLSMSQGFGFGLRPTFSGGVGAIIDRAGNDTYYSDIFGQAASYWWSLGIIYDSLGNDNYQSFQYAQGSAAHMTLGCLIDDYGNDVYSGKGLMQGVGHDYSCGLILDRHGNDTYTAYDLSQAAGSANGSGVLIDNEGDDRYFIKNPKNTHGYGNPRREFGSIGLFIDLGGDDQYTGEGRNNFFWKTDSKWGGGMDIELNPPDSTQAEAGK